MTQQQNIPDKWIACALGEVIETIRGVTYSKDQASLEPKPGYLPVLRATNIDRTINLDDFVYVPKSQVSSEQLLQIGDVVIAASSGSKSVVGKAAQLTQKWNGSFGAFCMGIRPNPEVEPRYVGLFLQSYEYRHAVSKLAAGSNINNLKREHIENFPFRLSPVVEQRRIVNKVDELLSDLDASVAALERARANLKRYRASVLKAAVEGRLTAAWRQQNRPAETASQLLERILAERRRKWEQAQLAKFAAAGKTPPKGWKDKYPEPAKPDTANLPELPEGWCWAAVDQCSSFESNAITDGPFGSNLKSEHYTEGGPRVIRLQNIGDGFFVDEYAHISDEHFASLKKHAVENGDLVIAVLGEELPRACVIPDGVAPAIVKADCVRFKPKAGLVDSDFMNYVLNSYPTRFRCSKQIKGVGRPRLNLSHIRSIAVPLPPVGEQAAIVSMVSDMFAAQDRMDQQLVKSIAQAAHLRQSILKRAFEGKLVPQDPKDEPASVLLERIRAARAGAPKAAARRGRKPKAAA